MGVGFKFGVVGGRDQSNRWMRRHAIEVACSVTRASSTSRAPSQRSERSEVGSPVPRSPEARVDPGEHAHDGERDGHDRRCSRTNSTNCSARPAGRRVGPGIRGGGSPALMTEIAGSTSPHLLIISDEMGRIEAVTLGAAEIRHVESIGVPWDAPRRPRRQ